MASVADARQGRSSGTERGRPSADRQALTFPDGPRLELDQLLGQLIERAQEVIATQGRLRGLLRANQTIARDLELPVVLTSIAEAARDLVGSRYAALGVIGGDGHLTEFVHVGMDPETVARIGDLPQGKGLLGALIEEPAPIRLDVISDDPRSSGFPAGHPLMRGFLGVPIRIRDAVFGNLYLAESTRGGFTREDEELITALAFSAAIAIENAHLYQAARTRQQWLQASAEISQRLLSNEVGDGGASLRLIAQHARQISDADLVTVMLPSDDEKTLSITVAVGELAERVEGRVVPMAGSLSGQVFLPKTPLRAAGPADHPGLVSAASGQLDVGPALVIPLLGAARVWGVLSMLRRAERAVFHSDDLDMASSFANQAAIALELAEARAEQQRAAMLDERDRIAADLHDQVIQRLFAAGLSLQSVLSRLGPGRAANLVGETIRNLDETINQIRTTVFQLHEPVDAEPVGVRARLLHTVSELTPALGFNPSLRFRGVLEDTLDVALVADLVAVVREALSNVARHAGARSAEIDVLAGAGKLTVTVADDGVGISGGTIRSSGLANLRERAQRHGGACALGAREPKGTVLTWSVPLA